MDDLLNIEQTAKESLSELDDEREALARRIAEETARRISDINLKAEQAIQALKQEVEANVQSELAEIESRYQQKAAQLIELFNANKAKWREEWTNRILQRGM